MFNALINQIDDQILQHLAGGELIRFIPSEGDPVEVRGIFDQAYEMMTEGEAGLSSFAPAVFVRAEDLEIEPLVDEDQIEVDGVLFHIRDIHRDGKGGSLLLLHTA